MNRFPRNTQILARLSDVLQGTTYYDQQGQELIYKSVGAIMQRHAGSMSFDSKSIVSWCSCLAQPATDLSKNDGVIL